MLLSIAYAVAQFGLLAVAVPLEDGIQEPPRRQEQKTDYHIAGTKRVKIRSGPYTIPSMKEQLYKGGPHGTLWNWDDRKIDKPCDGHCTIVRQWAGLEFPNGTNANIDNGLW